MEMNKWIEDLNVAIEMSKTSQEKSSTFLDAGVGDRSNRKRPTLTRLAPVDV